MNLYQTKIVSRKKKGANLPNDLNIQNENQRCLSDSHKNHKPGKHAHLRIESVYLYRKVSLKKELNAQEVHKLVVRCYLDP